MTPEEYAELLKQCRDSGQMEPDQQHEHEQAGELPKS